MLSKEDIEQIKKKGITEEDVKHQVEIFKRGFPSVDLAAPATPGDGILVIDEEQMANYEKKYEQDIGKYSVLKFIPASGAATRMFKNVYQWIQKLKEGQAPDKLMEEDSSAKKFFERITDFAFWQDLSDVMGNNGLDALDCLENKDFLPLLEYMLEDKGLGYGSLPKGLLKFHKKNSFRRTAFEEHLVEGALYGRNINGDVNIHFTVSPEHMELFKDHLNSVVKSYEKMYDVRYNIHFSIQDPSTDTLAVDMDNKPFRVDSGELLFRPGGHGALINNLNNLEEDVIFIKNIDNVVPDRLKQPTVQYKKIIGGVLIELQEEIHRLQEIIEKGDFSDKVYDEAVDFACTKLNFDRTLFQGQDEKGKERLCEMLFSPLRVCGMVKNEGEPGGGPFWVYSEDKTRSLQIIEASQINLDDPGQKEIFNNSTHFNPVDIVCGVKSWNGKKYDFKKYIDPETGFISHKSKDSRPLKAYELPGLWNGAMAKWITVFVEVPVITFNPVKTINDLLRAEHIG